MNDELRVRVSELARICKCKLMHSLTNTDIILPVRDERIYGIPASLADPESEGRECMASQDGKTMYMTFNASKLQARMEGLLYAKATD